MTAGTVADMVRKAQSKSIRPRPWTAADIAIGSGIGAAILAAAWSAYDSRNEYWAWLFPASIATGAAVSLTMRLNFVRHRADEVIAWCRFTIVAGLALVGLVSSETTLAVRWLMALSGPAMVLYLAQSVARRDAELEAKDREIDVLKMGATNLQSLNAITKLQQAQARTDAAVYATLLERSARSSRPRIAGHYRRTRTNARHASPRSSS